MFIRILRTGNHYDYVKDFMLDSLIESNEVVKFKRSTGWVTIGVDPIRGIKPERAFDGTDRRSAHDPINIQKYRRMTGVHSFLPNQRATQSEK